MLMIYYLQITCFRDVAFIAFNKIYNTSNTAYSYIIENFHYFCITAIITGVNVMSITAVTDLPRWRMRIQVRINIIVFVKIMDYSSVFHVLIDVS